MTWNAVLILVPLLIFVIAFCHSRWEDHKQNKKNWGVYPHDNEVHTVPRNDLVAHEWEDCACSPKTVPVQRDDGSIGWMVIHDALDGRE